jgi:hypothetical protein
VKLISDDLIAINVFSVQDIEAYKRRSQLYSHKQSATYQQQANQQRTAPASVKPQALIRRHPLQGSIEGKCEVWFGPCNRKYSEHGQPLPLDPDYVYVPSLRKVICRDEFVNAGWYVSYNRLHIILIDGTVLSSYGDFPYSWSRLLVNRTYS